MGINIITQLDPSDTWKATVLLAPSFAGPYGNGSSRREELLTARGKNLDDVLERLHTRSARKVHDYLSKCPPIHAARRYDVRDDDAYDSYDDDASDAGGSVWSARDDYVYPIHPRARNHHLRQPRGPKLSDEARFYDDYYADRTIRTNMPPPKTATAAPGDAKGAHSAIWTPNTSTTTSGPGLDPTRDPIRRIASPALSVSSSGSEATTAPPGDEDKKKPAAAAGDNDKEDWPVPSWAADLPPRLKETVASCPWIMDGTPCPPEMAAQASALYKQPEIRRAVDKAQAAARDRDAKARAYRMPSAPGGPFNMFPVVKNLDDDEEATSQPPPIMLPDADAAAAAASAAPGTGRPVLCVVKAHWIGHGTWSSVERVVLRESEIVNAAISSAAQSGGARAERPRAGSIKKVRVGKTEYLIRCPMSSLEVFVEGLGKAAGDEAALPVFEVDVYGEV